METTDTTRPGVLMGQLFDAVAAKDLDAMGALYHDDVVEDFVALGVIEGKETVGQFFSEIFTALPDMSLTPTRIIEGTDRTAIGEWLLTGTFSGGPFQGLEPTGRPVELRGIDVMEFEEGRLRHNTIYYDGLTFARQVGLLPADGSPGDRAITAGFNAFTKLRKSVTQSIRRLREGTTEAT